MSNDALKAEGGTQKNVTHSNFLFHYFIISRISKAYSSIIVSRIDLHRQFFDPPSVR